MKLKAQSVAFHGLLLVFLALQLWKPGWTAVAAFALTAILGAGVFRGIGITSVDSPELWFPKWLQVTLGVVASILCTPMAFFVPFELLAMIVIYSSALLAISLRRDKKSKSPGQVGFRDPGRGGGELERPQ